MAASGVEKMSLAPGALVCVTGASGYLGSWLVKRLLEKRYRVRASVRDPADLKKTALLRSLPGADERLQFVRGQLLEEGGLDDAVNGCDGVFHCACPSGFSFHVPEEECIELSFTATVTLLTACSKAPSIKRIVFLSSAASIKKTQLENVPGQRFNESCWTDVEMCRRDKPQGWTHFVTKTVSEKKALELAEEYKLDLIVILPTLVIGPFLMDRLPMAIAAVLSLITGDSSYYAFIRRVGYVHIDDMIDALIFLYETPAAQGRYIVSHVNASIVEIGELLKKLFPKIKLQYNLDDAGEIVPYYTDTSKLEKLGFEFKHGLAEMLESTVKCSVEKGLLQAP